MKKTLLGLVALATLSISIGAKATISNKNINKTEQIEAENVLDEEKKNGKGDFDLPIRPKLKLPGTFYDIPENVNPTKIPSAFYFEKLGNRFGQVNGNSASLIAAQMLLGYYDTFVNDKVVREQFDIVSEEAINSESVPTAEDFSHSPGTNDAFTEALISLCTGPHNDINVDPITEGLSKFDVDTLIRSALSKNKVTYTPNVAFGGEMKTTLTTKFKIKNAINNGRPVLVQGGDNFAIAYAYDDDYVYVKTVDGDCKILTWETFYMERLMLSSDMGAALDYDISVHNHSNNYYDLTTQTTICPCGHCFSETEINASDLFDYGQNISNTMVYESRHVGGLNINYGHKGIKILPVLNSMQLYRDSSIERDAVLEVLTDKPLNSIKFDYYATNYEDLIYGDKTELQLWSLVKGENGLSSWTDKQTYSLTYLDTQTLHINKTFNQNVIGFKLALVRVDGKNSRDYHLAIDNMVVNHSPLVDGSDIKISQYIYPGFLLPSNLENQSSPTYVEGTQGDLHYQFLHHNVTRNFSGAVIEMNLEENFSRTSDLRFIFDKEISKLEFINCALSTEDYEKRDLATLKVFALQKNSRNHLVWNESAVAPMGRNDSNAEHTTVDFDQPTYGFKVEFSTSSSNYPLNPIHIGVGNFKVTHSFANYSENVGFKSNVNLCNMQCVNSTCSGRGSMVEDYLKIDYRFIFGHKTADNQGFIINNNDPDAHSEGYADIRFNQEMFGIEFDVRYFDVDSYNNRNTAGVAFQTGQWWAGSLTYEFSNYPTRILLGDGYELNYEHVSINYTPALNTGFKFLIGKSYAAPIKIEVRNITVLHDAAYSVNKDKA